MGRVSDAKQRLMEAVRELIWAGSYGSTTIDQICEKAGVKKGSFYYFFDSKADLAVTAIEGEWKNRRTELDAVKCFDDIDLSKGSLLAFLAKLIHRFCGT